VINGQKGTATMIDSATGVFQYTPDALGARGSDTFIYKIEKPGAETRSGEVTVIIDPRLMLLGDSITTGIMNGAKQLPVPEERVGYRKPLQQKLNAAGYHMDFVGSQPFGAGMPGFDYQSKAHAGRTPPEIAVGSQAKDLNHPDIGIIPMPIFMHGLTRIRPTSCCCTWARRIWSRAVSPASRPYSTRSTAGNRT
jgi:hypothetical protein